MSDYWARLIQEPVALTLGSLSLAFVIVFWGVQPLIRKWRHR